jgi:predicted outer membrane repeat protein
VVSNTATIGAGGGSLNNGGGILNFNSGSLNIINSTLSGNSATTSGGAIASTGSLAVSFSTISANSAPSGGGIAATGGGATRPGQRVVLLLANPSAATVRVVATLHGNDGRTVQQHVTLPPYGQSTLDVGRIFQRATGVHGVRVTSANGEGFLAEQTVFAADGSTLQRTQGLAQ